jgi:hypothetical protein
MSTSLIPSIMMRSGQKQVERFPNELRTTYTVEANSNAGVKIHKLLCGFYAGNEQRPANFIERHYTNEEESDCVEKYVYFTREKSA